MTVDQAVAKTLLLATGKATTLAAGSSKYTRILALLNLAKDVWADEPDVWWDSLRRYTALAALITATDSFSVGAVDHVSKREGDFVFIVHTNGTTISKYTIVAGNSLYDDDLDYEGDGVCAVMGGNLVFPRAFTTTDAQFGGTIKMPHYPAPADMTSGSDTIKTDSPTWSCLFAAGEFIRNDLVRQNQYGNLVAQANNAMIGMIDRNDSQLAQISVAAAGAAFGESW